MPNLSNSYHRKTIKKVTTNSHHEPREYKYLGEEVGIIENFLRNRMSGVKFWFSECTRKKHGHQGELHLFCECDSEQGLPSSLRIDMLPIKVQEELIEILPEDFI